MFIKDVLSVTLYTRPLDKVHLILMSGYRVVTLTISYSIKQTVTSRVRSVWESFFHMAHSLSLFLHLHRSISLSWEQVERFLREIDVFAQEWNGTVGMGCVGVMVSCPHGLTGEWKCSSEWGQVLGKGSGQKGQSGLSLHLSHPRIADFLAVVLNWSAHNDVNEALKG